MHRPEVARVPMYKAWTIAFGCNLDEMKNPLESYANLAEVILRVVYVLNWSFSFSVVS